MVKIEYKNDAERAQAISDNSSLVLVEDQLHEDGKFLLFDSAPRAPKKTVDEEIADIKARLTALEAVNKVSSSAV